MHVIEGYELGRHHQQRSPAPVSTASKRYVDLLHGPSSKLPPSPPVSVIGRGYRSDMTGSSRGEFDPKVVRIEQPTNGALSWAEWVAALENDEPVELSVSAAEILREIREHENG